jgi:hypothetical protein
MEGDPQMSLKINPTLLAGAALIGVMTLGLGGCGKKGLLDQPAPLFGERAKEDYAAKQGAAAAAANQEKAKTPVAAADQPDPDADSAPKTTREVKSPEQDNVPITQAPIPGAPDLMGPMPSLKPPTGR